MLDRNIKFLLNLAESELKIVLEALVEKENAMAELCDQSQDDDEIARVGNDLIELRLLLGPIKKRAVEEFGERITMFSNKLL